MDPDNRSSKDGKNGRSNGGADPNFSWRSLILVAVFFGLIGAFWVAHPGVGANTKELPYDQFRKYLDDGKIFKDDKHPLDLIIEEGSTTQALSGYYSSVLPPQPDNPNTLTRFRTTLSLDFDRELQQRLKDASLVPNIRKESNFLASTLLGFVPIAMFLLILYFFFRQQIRMAGKGAMNFGKSKARMMARDKNKITFKDVAGVEEAKDEVQELVEFLKDPKKFQKLGGRIPKGVLMIGSPGTGKTLLARAIAGEADVPFFSISGSDFVEMFVGVGASRVRDMFEQGRKSAPCLIFIDEIDAVGRHRGHGVGGGHDEREQTLNALLVEMDGFDAQEGIIIIAATNRPDVLDPALLRPGRFDRQVNVALPDVKGREAILRVHAKRVKITEDVNMGIIARGTPGYSGAELANVINEAALLAARRGLKAITLSELEEARDKVRWGRERRSLAISEKEKKITAYHEAGHAILNVLLEHTDPLHKVTIIPRGPALGVTMMLPQEDKFNTKKKELIDDLCVTMGGRVAEEMFLGDVSSGASGDIRMATWYARKMVCQWGMSEKMGMVEYGEHEDYVFLGRDISKSRDYSEATAQEIDREVRKLCDDAYARAKEIIITNREKLELIAKALLEFETLEGSQINDILQHGRMLNPPKSLPPSTPNPPAPTKGATSEKEGVTLSPDYPTGLTEAPAGA
jgi:cell division protease FtsH